MTTPKRLHLSENDKKSLRVGLRERQRERERKEDLRRKYFDWRHVV